MFQHALKALLFLSATLFMVNTSAVALKRDLELEQVEISLTRRQWGQVGASVSAQALVQGWASVNSALSQCQNTFQQASSVQVAVQAAVSVSASIKAAASQYGQCSCGGGDPSGLQAQAQFQSVMTQFFASFQAILQVGASRFGGAWQSQFTPIFQRCSPGFEAMKSISASLQINLQAVIQQVHLDANLFVGVGLNLSVLLGINLSLGLGLGLGGLIN